MESFRKVVELYDFGFKGDKFTWSNNQEEGNYTKERLDRAFANKRWREVYSHVLVDRQVARFSYHKPLILSIREGMGRNQMRNKLFRYEAWWRKEEQC